MATTALARVLLVEDDTDLRRMFASTLQMAGYEVLQAGDGVTALRVIEAERPDLAVLDIGLPTLDGLAVHAELAIQLPSVPVLIVTGSTFDLRGIDAECILRKPVSPDRLVTAVQDCLKRRARSDRTGST